MDRKVFSMIAATVFLLTMIIATIQMQISMIEKAADDIETDFGAYAYPIAGSLYVLNHNSPDEMGHIYGDELGDSLSTTSEGTCSFEYSGGDMKPGFDSDELLKVEHSISEISPTCESDTYSYGTGGSRYRTYSTTTATTVDPYGTSFEFIFMRKEDSGGDTELNPETIKVSQKSFQP